MVDYVYQPETIKLWHPQNENKKILSQIKKEIKDYVSENNLIVLVICAHLEIFTMIF